MTGFHAQLWHAAPVLAALVVLAVVVVIVVRGRR